MSAPKTGGDSAGVKIEADGVTLLQDFVVVGPSIISVGGGTSQCDAEAIASLLETQVKRYQNAAMG